MRAVRGLRSVFCCLGLMPLCGVLQAQEQSPAPVEQALSAGAAQRDFEAAERNAITTAAVPAEPAEPAATVEAPGELQPLHSGVASWYGDRFHGRRTASGEPFDMHALTAAHPTLPFGSIVRVRSLINNRVVDVRINDRGPYAGGRIIDLSRAAAAVLGLIQSGAGTKPVQLDLLQASREVPQRPRRFFNARRNPGSAVR